MPRTERLDLTRKIIANMTAESWRGTPYCAFVYEPEATGFLAVLEEINAGRGAGEAITINTAMLRIIAEGIRACPKMNGHIRFSPLLVSGKVTLMENIDVTMPVMLDAETMMTLNIRGLEHKSMDEIRDTVADSVRRARNSNMQQVMYEVSLHDTFTEMKRLHLIRAMGRFLGFWLEGGPKTLLHGAEKRRYNAIPATERLTRHDLEQGTIAITNPGSLYRGLDRTATLLDIIPPQLVMLAINPVLDRPVVDKNGTLRAGKVLPLTVVYDHRALDASDLVPFVKRLDEVFSAPEALKGF